MARILIVEDDSDAAGALETFLSNAGHEVALAPAGSEALVALTQSAPDLIVLDLLLPRMDGADLLSIVRSYSRLKSIPVVVWTGAGDSLVLHRARHHDVAAVVLKGNATYNELLAAIAKTLGGPVQ